MGRFPAGTNPAAAIREVMGVFMERTDGTNAMPWWLRCEWWAADRIGLPPGEQRGRLYVLNDYAETFKWLVATSFPAFIDGGMPNGLYRVTFPNEPTLALDHPSLYLADDVTIRERLPIPRTMLDQALQELAAAHHSPE